CKTVGRAANVRFKSAGLHLHRNFEGVPAQKGEPARVIIIDVEGAIVAYKRLHRDILVRNRTRNPLQAGPALNSRPCEWAIRGHELNPSLMSRRTLPHSGLQGSGSRCDLSFETSKWT